MLHTLVLALENERKKNPHILQKDSVSSALNTVFPLERQTIKCSTLKPIDDFWKNYRESISGLCAETGEF